MDTLYVYNIYYLGEKVKGNLIYLKDSLKPKSLILLMQLKIIKKTLDKRKALVILPYMSMKYISGAVIGGLLTVLLFTGRFAHYAPAQARGRIDFEALKAA